MVRKEVQTVTRLGTYHLSKCMLASFSGSLGGNIVGRICVCRPVGTSDQSEYHWPSLVISYRAKQTIHIQDKKPQDAKTKLSS